MAYHIATKKDYHETMVSVYNLMSKGEANLTEQEAVAVREMAHAAEVYEDEVLGLKPDLQPKTISDIVLQKMYENRMTQAMLATELGLAKSKLNEILNGKRKPDVAFLKALYTKLHIDPAFLLEQA